MKVPIRVACRKSRGRETVPKQGGWAPSLPSADAFRAQPCGFTEQLERTHKLCLLLPAEKESAGLQNPTLPLEGGMENRREGRTRLPSAGYLGPAAQIWGLKEGEGEWAAWALLLLASCTMGPTVG